MVSAPSIARFVANCVVHAGISREEEAWRHSSRGVADTKLVVVAPCCRAKASPQTIRGSTGGIVGSTDGEVLGRGRRLLEPGLSATVMVDSKNLLEWSCATISSVAVGPIRCA